MDSLLNTMASRLSAQDMRRLKAIYAPQVMAVPPNNACIDLCVLADGEIRHYGEKDGQRMYLASRDCGLSWKEYDVEDRSVFCSGRQNPHTGRWFASFSIEGEDGYQPGQLPTPPAEASGWYALLSDEGPDGQVRWVKISDLPAIVPRPAFFLKNSSRVLIFAQTKDEVFGGYHPVEAISDDNGETWRVIHLQGVPAHISTPPHKGPRWQNGSCEATLAERSDGSLLLLSRTSHDYLYQYESFDGGLTWTDPRPSTFHNTLTMPCLLRLSDGAILSIWCNTQPLPELDKTTLSPALVESEINGWGGEDVFTNRDANHAAISFDDGKTWRGFRELLLNPVRSRTDFRSVGGFAGGNDKSVHQFQAIELPYGKILMVCGQNVESRRIVIFDPRWLLEDSRSEDFSTGIGNLSTQVYLKSISGNARWKNGSRLPGHCSWNRTEGACMAPSPDGNFEEALYIRPGVDPMLYCATQGAVWNFPAAHSGRVQIRLLMRESGVRLTLTDRWFNPCDTACASLSPFSVDLDSSSLPREKWLEISLEWKDGVCRAFADEALFAELEASAMYPHGLSYLVIQSPDEYRGEGTYIKTLSMNAQ